MTNYPEIIINTDGGARGNPGPAAIGIVMSSQKDGTNFLFEHSQTIGNQTNNVAEYMAVITALHLYIKKNLSADVVDFILDSELVVRQIVGQYRVKEARLQSLVAQVHQLIKKLKDQGVAKIVNFHHVPRAENKRADQLVNQALDSQ